MIIIRQSEHKIEHFDKTIVLSTSICWQITFALSPSKWQTLNKRLQKNIQDNKSWWDEHFYLQTLRGSSLFQGWTCGIDIFFIEVLADGWLGRLLFLNIFSHLNWTNFIKLNSSVMQFSNYSGWSFFSQ